MVPPQIVVAEQSWTGIEYYLKYVDAFRERATWNPFSNNEDHEGWWEFNELIRKDTAHPGWNTYGKYYIRDTSHVVTQNEVRA